METIKDHGALVHWKRRLHELQDRLKHETNEHMRFLKLHMRDKEDKEILITKIKDLELSLADEMRKRDLLEAENQILRDAQNIKDDESYESIIMALRNQLDNQAKLYVRSNGILKERISNSENKLDAKREEFLDSNDMLADKVMKYQKYAQKCLSELCDAEEECELIKQDAIRSQQTLEDEIQYLRRRVNDPSQINIHKSMEKEIEEIKRTYQKKLSQCQNELLMWKSHSKNNFY